MSALTSPTFSSLLPASYDATNRKLPVRDWARPAAKIGIVLLSLGILFLAYTTHSHVQAAKMLWHNPIGRFLLIFGSTYGLFGTVWSFWRLWLSIRYRPFPLVEDARLPRITVIVPAYNEGALVERSLRSLAAADYPADRLEIIAVDDGSKDDTWSYMCKAARAIGAKVRVLHFDENRGKRFALWEGFQRGTGEIFVTVDSDTIVERDALKHLVSPMVANPQIGAVAGNVRVLNRREALIPRMLGVRYVMTFDYKRAAQSMMGGGAVQCCAGALAAYRRKAVQPILAQWLNQTFLGGHARAGEDHAMTNFILKQGHKVVYQRTARVNTNTPTTYNGMAKMFLRWLSNIRESVHTASYLFTNFRRGPKLGLRFNFLMTAIGLVLPYPLLATAFVLSFIYPQIFGLKLLAMCVTGASFSVIFYAIRERDTEAVFAVPYAFYSTILLCWVQPYATFTCNRSVWLTRTLGGAKKQAPAEQAPTMAPVLAAA